MFSNPVEKGALKSDVIALLFGLDPLVLQNLVPFRQKLLIEAGALREVSVGGGFRHIFILLTHCGGLVTSL